MLEYNLYNDDCMRVLPTLPTGSVDFVLADPPYGVTARNDWDRQLDMESLWPEIWRVCTGNAAVVLFSSGMFTANLMYSCQRAWRYNLVWHKTEPTGFLNARRMPLRSHEDICVFYRKLPYYNPIKTTGHARKVSSAASQAKCRISTNYNESENSAADYDSTERFPTSILTFSTDKQKPYGRLHPTQKPQALCEWLIRTYCPEGGTVLDFCMGSGTTGAAAKQCVRSFIGIELDDAYFATAVDRIGPCSRVCTIDAQPVSPALPHDREPMAV